MTIAPQQHSTYQFFPPLRPQERAALKRSIAVDGMRNPIERDRDGKILDGYQRWEIAQELGWTEEQIPTIVRTELTTEADKIEHTLKINVLRRKSVSPLTIAKCIRALMEARGIDTTTNHNRHTAREDTLSALWEELGLNPRSGRRYMQWYEELKDHPKLCQQVEAGTKMIIQARREVGIVITKPRKKTSLLQQKGVMRSIRSFLWPNGNLSIIGKSATLPLLQRISDGLSRGYLVIRGPCK